MLKSTTSISAATLEQTSGIENVNQAIGEMDSVVQKNAALVEEAAAAAASLQEQAVTLSDVVSVFKLDAKLVAPVVAKQTTKTKAGKLPARAPKSSERKHPEVLMKKAITPAVDKDSWEEF